MRYVGWNGWREEMKSKSYTNLERTINFFLVRFQANKIKIIKIQFTIHFGKIFILRILSPHNVFFSSVVSFVAVAVVFI